MTIVITTIILIIIIIIINKVKNGEKMSRKSDLHLRSAAYTIIIIVIIYVVL